MYKILDNGLGEYIEASIYEDTQAEGLKKNGGASKGVWVPDLILISKCLIFKIRQNCGKFVLYISKSSNLTVGHITHGIPHYHQTAVFPSVDRSKRLRHLQ